MNPSAFGTPCQQASDKSPSITGGEVARTAGKERLDSAAAAAEVPANTAQAKKSPAAATRRLSDVRTGIRRNVVNV